MPNFSSLPRARDNTELFVKSLSQLYLTLFGNITLHYIAGLEVAEKFVVVAGGGVGENT